MCDDASDVSSEDGTRSLQSLVADANRGRRRQLHVGTAIMPHLLDDLKYEAVANEHFDHVVCEHHHKWEPLLAKRADGTEVYDFTQSDRIVDWARRGGNKVKGHTLVWHVTSPKWIEEAPQARLREAVFEHIKTTMNHCLGKVYAWDVVNEPLHPDATGRLADTPFLRKLGPAYIDDCFRVAHHTDPNAVLILNENKGEGAGLPRGRSAKADALFALSRDLLARGVPLHEVGLQAHFDAAGTGQRRVPTPHSVARNIARFGDLGLGVNISEMDVRAAGLEQVGLGLAQRDAAAAAVFHDTLAAALAQPAFTGVTFWGFCDAHSWCHDFYKCVDRPLLWDAAWRPKPALAAVRRALRGAACSENGLRNAEAAAAAAEGAAEQDPDAFSTAAFGSEELWGSDWMLPEPVEGGAGGTGAGPVAGVSVDEPDWSAGQRYVDVTANVTAHVTARPQPAVHESNR
ncbi:glycoside hydrolase superfamily [Tribonema minus]|uniref:endo-1,4-beta-xylanase n=1 Tax=Tribonema minus TaxID=303371 RepID=A0A835YP39_9STRA|nr:glycoside hydrolase superfamily [Tribonema minus]